MKKKASWVVFILCVAIFVALRWIAFSKDHAQTTSLVKPSVPKPSHRWLEWQDPDLVINHVIMQDLLDLKQCCEQIKDLNPLQAETLVIQHLNSLHEQVPINLPKEFYRVICIPEQPWVKTPIPFNIYQRLYLGDTSLGFPFYLDVRVFELKEHASSDIIKWHLNILDGKPILCSQSEGRESYIIKGERLIDASHGFSKEERGLYVDAIEKEGYLFILYAEAPIKTFEAKLSIFHQIAQKRSTS